jgi:hypothetical protein
MTTWACRVCGGEQIDEDGYCTRCRAYAGRPDGGADQTGATTAVPSMYGLPPAPVAPPTEPKDRIPIIVGAIVALLAIAVICCAGVGLLAWRRGAVPDAVPTAPSASAPSPSAQPLSLARCVIGTWLENSHANDGEIDGRTIRLLSSGSIQRFAADGTVVLDMSEGIVRSGERDGDTYTVTSTGTITFRYQIIGTQAHYSDVQATGTAVWRRNGREFDRQPLRGSIGAETITCTGDTMAQYGEGYSIELTRVLP